MADDPIRQAEEVSVWRALGELRLKELAWPEGLAALIIGAGGGAYLAHATTLDDRRALALPVAALGGALLAIVFTALAILVSLPPSGYLRMLAETPGGGMWRFLSAFLVALGEQIAIIVIALTYAALAAHVRHAIEAAVFVVLTFLTTFGLLDIAALGRQLVRHGILRAEDAVLESAETGVHPFPAARRR